MDSVHHLRSIDLNLLVVLDALLAERHVTRAGKRLGLSQSATSNALERLRSLFGDPLLERTGAGMRPTPRAQALRPSLDDALASLARVVAPRADLVAISQTIRLALVDYGIALLGPPLATALRASAPGVDLVVAPWTGADDDFTRVTDGSLDLVVGVLAPGAAALRWEPLFSERYVVAMRRSHPARKRWSLEEWIRHPHVVVSGRGQTTGSLDAVLATRGKTRRVGMVVPSFLAVPAIVANSDYLALIPERLLATGRYEDVVARDPPVPVPAFEVGIAWHPRRDHDAATMHVARLLREIGRAGASRTRRANPRFAGTRRHAPPTHGEAPRRRVTT